jgi:PAS domain S-box-containing protein
MAARKQNMKQPKSTQPARTALIYIVFGALWILLTDSILEFFFPTTHQNYTLLQTIKGWLFVCVSALLIYFILRRDVSALNESEQRYKLLFDNNPNPMWVYDAETLRFLTVNDAAIEHYGYTREEFLAMTLKDIRPEEEVATLMANVAAQTAPLQRSVGWKHRKKDGTLIDVEISSHSLKFGERPARLALAHDITEKKAAEQALIQSEAQFRSLVEQLPAITYIAALDEISSTIYISPQVEEMLGIPVDEYIKKPTLWFEHIHPNDRERVLEEIRQSHEEGKPFASEYRMVADNGGIIWFQDEGNLIRDKNGKPLFLEGVMYDITERKASAEKIAHQAELLSNVHDAIVGTDAGFHVTYWNKTAEEIFGWTEQEALGKETKYLLKTKIPGSSREEKLEKLMSTGQYSGEVLYARKDGTYINADIRSVVLKDELGNIKGVLSSIRDITERKQSELTLRRNEQILREAQTIAKLGSWTADLKAGLFYVNSETAQLMGWPVGVQPLEELLKAAHPQDRAMIEARWSDALQQGSEYDVEHRIIVNGEVYWMHATAKITFDTDGTPLSAIGILQDITERKQSELALRENEERYRRTLDNMLEGCQIINFDWRYTYINNVAARQGRSNKEELLNRTMMEVYPGIEDTELFAALRECMEKRITKHMENKFVYSDGTSGWFELNIQPVEEGIFILSIDSTERKLAEEQLRTSEERFHQLAENIEEGFWITDPNTEQEIYLSPAHEKIWERSIEEIKQGKNIFLDSVLDEDKPRVQAELQKQKLGHPSDIEYRIQRKDGSVRWIWDRAFPILGDNGKVQLVAGLVSDITERKQATERIQTQLERLKALSAIDNAISTSMDMRLTLDIFIREAISQLKVDAADVLLLNNGLLVLEYAAGSGFRSPHWGHDDLKLGEGLGGRAALKQQRIHVPNLVNFEDEFVHLHLHQEEGFITYFGIPLIAKGQVKGVLEVYHRSALNPDSEWIDYLNTLAGQAAIAIDNAQLFENIQRSNFELTMAYDATIAGWSHAMDLRDKETEGHTQRVTEITIQLAEMMGISKQEQIQIRRGALLHDIGKLGVPDHILLKPGKLTDEEWVIMRQHPTYAYEMLRPIHYLRPALDIPYCHHEKWDGSGYPRKLKGDEIPLSARIFAVVDVWDALRSDRPYRDGWSAEKTRDYIQAESGKHFDPQVVIEFMKLLDGMKDIRK